MRSSRRLHARESREELGKEVGQWMNKLRDGYDEPKIVEEKTESVIQWDREGYTTMML